MSDGKAAFASAALIQQERADRWAEVAHALAESLKRCPPAQSVYSHHPDYLVKVEARHEALAAYRALAGEDDRG